MQAPKFEIDTSKLRGRIIEKYRTLGAFAKAMEWAPATVGNKLNGKRYWDQEEIVRACYFLDLAPEEIPHYFFTLKVINL